MDPEAIVAVLRPGDHVCVPISGNTQRRAVLREFVRAGVRDGHRVLCFVAAEPRGPTLTAGRPGQVRITVRDRAGVSYRRQLDVLAAEVTLAARDGYSGLRVAGDMTWVLRGARTLSVTSTRDLVDFEATITPLVGRAAAIAVCLYDRRHFPPSTLRAVGTVHAGTAPVHAGTAPVQDGALLRFGYTASGVTLAGEVDESNLGALRAVLAELPPARRTVVDAGELRFVSAGAAAELLRAGARSRDLRISCTRAVAQILGAAGASTVRGLTVESALDIQS